MNDDSRRLLLKLFKMAGKEDEEPKQALRTHQKIAVGAGLTLPVMALAMWYTYSVAFFEKVLGLPAKPTGTVIFVAQIAGALSGPLVGIWSDQSNYRWGTKKMTHFIGAVTVAVTFAFIWHECISCDDTPSAYQTVYFASFAALSLIGTTTSQTAILALIPKLATDEKIIVEINSIW